MSALEELMERARAFELAKIECDRILSERAEVDPRDRHSVGVIGQDIVDSSLFAIPLGANLSIQATNRGIEDLRAGRFPTEDVPEFGEGVKAARLPGQRVRGHNALFRLTIKSTYFLVRSFQDAVYRVAYQVLEGKKARGGQSASMTAVLKSNDPVRKMLGDFAVEYETWFVGWRTIRDRIKLGQGAAILGSFIPGAPPDDIGISLSLVTPEGGLATDLSKGTRVSDVTRAVVMSTELVERLTEVVRHSA